MTTYQDIVDYLNKNYWKGFKLFYTNPGCIIANNDDDYDHYDHSISIGEDSYAATINIDKGLNKLLADLLDTPVDQRIKPEIKHTIKPVTKESARNTNLITVDQVIQAINTFIIRTRFNSNPTMTIVTNIGEDNLNKVLKLYGDYNIRITNRMPLLNPAAFDLLIEPK